MRAQIFFQDDLVDEANMTGPVFSGQRSREGKVEGEIVVLIGEISEIVFVENFLHRARPIPEADLSSSLLGLEEVGKMGAERSHASPSANVNHFALGRLDVEVTEWTDGGDRVSGLKVEDVR